MVKKKIKLSDLEPGPIQHAGLSPQLIARIKAYKKILGRADLTSTDDAIDGFRRDMHPDKEVAMWEHIADVFREFTARHGLVLDALRREVLRAILLLSTGTDPKPNATLTAQNIAELKARFSQRH